MSLLSVGISPLESINRRKPDRLKSVEINSAEFDEWLSSLVAKDNSSEAKFSIYVDNDWFDRLRPLWNYDPDGITAESQREADIGMFSEAVLYNKHKKFFMENLASLLSGALKFFNPQTAAVAALRQAVAMLIGQDVQDFKKIDAVLNAYPGLSRYAEPIYKQAYAIRTGAFMDWQKNSGSTFQLLLLSFVELLNFNRGNLVGDNQVPANVLILSYDTLVRMGVPLYHHCPDLLPENVSKTISQARGANIFSNYTLEDLHSECCLCDEFVTDSCVSLNEHLEECFLKQDRMCCGIKFVTYRDAIAHFAAFCRKKKRLKNDSKCNFCTCNKCYCDKNGLDMVRAGNVIYKQKYASSHVARNNFYSWVVDAISCYIREGADSVTPMKEQIKSMLVKDEKDFKQLLGTHLNLSDSKMESILPIIEVTGKNPILTYELDLNTSIIGITKNDDPEDFSCETKEVVDINISIIDLVVDIKTIYQYVCEPFRSMDIYFDLYNKIVGSMSSRCHFKECSGIVADINHMSTNHLTCKYCVPKAGFMPSVLSYSKHMEHMNKHSIQNDQNLCCGICDTVFVAGTKVVSLGKIVEHLRGHYKKLNVVNTQGKPRMVLKWDCAGYIKYNCPYGQRGFHTCVSKVFTHPADVVIHYVKYHNNQSYDGWRGFIDNIVTDCTLNLKDRYDYLTIQQKDNARRRRKNLLPTEEGAVPPTPLVDPKRNENQILDAQKIQDAAMLNNLKRTRSKKPYSAENSDDSGDELELTEAVNETKVSMKQLTTAPIQIVTSAMMTDNNGRPDSAQSNFGDDEDDYGDSSGNPGNPGNPGGSGGRKNNSSDGDDDKSDPGKSQDKVLGSGPSWKWYYCKNSGHISEPDYASRGPPKFTTQAGLNLHVQKKHRCDAKDCTYSNMSQTILWRHYEARHKMGAEYCKVCDEEVPNLATHIKMHEICNICIKEFKSKDDLKKHQRTCKNLRMEKEEPYKETMLVTLPDEDEDQRELLIDTSKTDNWITLHMCTLVQNTNMPEEQKARMVEDLKRHQVIKDQRRNALVERKFERTNKYIASLIAPTFYETSNKMPKKADLNDLSSRDIFRGTITNDVDKNREQFRHLDSLNLKIRMVVERFFLCEKIAVNLFSDYLADEVKQFICTRQCITENEFNTLQFQDLLDLLVGIFGIVDLRQLHYAIREYKKKPNEPMMTFFSTMRRCLEMCKILQPEHRREAYVEEGLRKVYKRNMPPEIEKDLDMTEIQMGKFLTSTQILKYYIREVHDGTFKDSTKNRPEIMINAINRKQNQNLTNSANSTVRKLFGNKDESYSKNDSRSQKQEKPKQNKKKFKGDRTGKKRTTADKPWQNPPARPPAAGQRLKHSGPRSRNATHEDYAKKQKKNRNIEANGARNDAKNKTPVNQRLMRMANYGPNNPSQVKRGGQKKEARKPTPESVQKHKALLKAGFQPKSEIYCFLCLDSDHISPRCKKYNPKKQPEVFHQSHICMREDKKLMRTVPCGIHPLNQCVRQRKTQNIRFSTRPITIGYKQKN